MLREASLGLARTFDTVSVVARHADALAASSGINPLSLDYSDSAALTRALRQAVETHGPVSLAVCWIHSTAPGALGLVAQELARPGEPARLFHVRGSAAADPSRLPRPGLDAVPEPVQYREVILGFIVEGERSRWLTNSEISSGVLRAVASDAARSIIGTVEPWHMRP
ncbi:MAG: hypothetical protein JWN15_529 [Firmicutes bacterium]|nr:hypothetical protein [Bacillota bacterium]